jgi:hypothetical protein
VNPRGRGTARRVGVACAALALLACRPHRAVWSARLATPAVARLEGEWNVHLALAGDTAQTGRAVDGLIALVLNRQRRATSLFGLLPDAYGSWDIPFERLGPSVAPYPGPPEVWARTRGDSVFVRLSPRVEDAIVLAGTWTGDSITGRWFTAERAGPNALGAFVLRHR